MRGYRCVCVVLIYLHPVNVLGKEIRKHPVQDHCQHQFPSLLIPKELEGGLFLSRVSGLGGLRRRKSPGRARPPLPPPAAAWTGLGFLPQVCSGHQSFCPLLAWHFCWESSAAPNSGTRAGPGVVGPCLGGKALDLCWPYICPLSWVWMMALETYSCSVPFPHCGLWAGPSLLRASRSPLYRMGKAQGPSASGDGLLGPIERRWERRGDPFSPHAAARPHLRFWYQVLTCVSVRLSDAASSMRS